MRLRAGVKKFEAIEASGDQGDDTGGAARYEADDLPFIAKSPK
jgi:hypothetical protein